MRIPFEGLGLTVIDERISVRLCAQALALKSSSDSHNEIARRNAAVCMGPERTYFSVLLNIHIHVVKFRSRENKLRICPHRTIMFAFILHDGSS